MPGFDYHLCTGNEIIWCKDRHPLVLTCFVFFLICIMMSTCASGSIYKPCISHTLVISTKAGYQIANKIQDFGCPPLCIENDKYATVQGSFIGSEVCHVLP